MSKLDTIAVGVDGSDNARKALVWAASVASLVDGALLVVHALGLMEHLDDQDLAVTSKVLHRVRALLDGEWVQPLRDGEARFETILEHGPPVIALPRVVAERDVDLLVVGSRGRGGAPTLLLGSTSHQLVQVIDIPITIVPSQ
jgi:nucleotide-binding universal stress UspA family protein